MQFISAVISNNLAGMS